MSTEKDQKRKDDDDDGELHRLTDIRTKEVSIVDRGANKRRFLVVKREGEGSDMAKTTNPTEPKAATPPAPPAPVAKKGPTPENPMGAVDVPAPLDNPERRGMDVDTTGAPITAYPEIQPSPPEAPKFTDDMPSAAGFAEGLTSVAKSVSELATSKIEDAAVLKSKFAEIGKVFDKLATDAASAFDEVHKRGAKMAAKRLETMEKAVTELGKLVKELKGMGVSENGNTGARDEPQGTPPKEGVSDRAKTQKLDGGETATPPEAQIPAAVQATLDAVNANLAKISEGLAGVTRVVKTQQVTIQKMAGELPGSNVGEVGERGGSPAIEDIAWPLDMNNVPDRKEVTKKGTSFFGERKD